jgi:hypothetical protein
MKEPLIKFSYYVEKSRPLRSVSQGGNENHYNREDVKLPQSYENLGTRSIKRISGNILHDSSAEEVKNKVEVSNAEPIKKQVD